MGKIFDVGIAAGMLKNESDFDKKAMASVASLAVGSFTLLQRGGNKEPTSFWDEESQTGFNAIGLRNQSLAVFLAEEAPLLRKLFNETRTQVDVSLAPTEKDELREMCRILKQNQHALPVRFAEVNAACPNHRKGENLQPVLAYDPEAVDELLMELKDCPYAVSLKIAPDTPAGILFEIVKLCIKYDVKEIVSGNTRGSEAIWKDKPVLSVPRGGKSGKPLFEDAVEQVAILKTIIDEQHSDIKVRGIGGIFTTEDIAIMRNVGADSVSVASLFYFGGGWDAVAKLSTDFNLR
jgi:dihydroorotate dehydrogenase